MHIAENAENIPSSSDIDGVHHECVRALFAAVENSQIQYYGRKEKIPKGSAVAEILRDGILCDADAFRAYSNGQFDRDVGQTKFKLNINGLFPRPVSHRYFHLKSVRRYC